MHSSHPLGAVASLWRYPVKSLAAQPLKRAMLGERGFEGDRDAALFVATPAHARTGKTYRGKENELLHTLGGSARATELAAERGVNVALRTHGPYFDAAPVSIVFDTWISALENIVYEPIDPLRFRPNVYALAAPDFTASERDLVDALLAIGDVRLRCTATIARCITPTYDVATGARDPAIARAIARDLGNVLGVYCSVERAGEIELGAQIALA